MSKQILILRQIHVYHFLSEKKSEANWKSSARFDRITSSLPCKCIYAFKNYY